VTLPQHGIEPVPEELQRLGLVDNGVLFGSLGVGLLVLVSGSFLVPALGIWKAFAAIAVGSALGGLILGAIAALAASTHVPAMVLLRAPLGVRGSYVPTALNVAQSFGWTVFEIIVIAQAATAAVGGPDWLWTLLASALVTGLALGGPLVVVRRVLRLVGVPLTLACGLYLTWWAATRVDFGAARHGEGGLTLLQGVDLAIAIPISWAPLVADYARFSRSPRAAFAGTALGASLSNAWFYALGALLLLAGAADPGTGLTAAPGALALGLLALAETDKPFADLYSTAISIQNWQPRLPGPLLCVGLGAATAVTALVVPFDRYSAFLYLLGAFFVPLAGVQLAHALRVRRIPVDELYRPGGAFGSLDGGGIAAWLAGVLVYEWITPTTVRVASDVVDWLSDLAGGAPPDALARFGSSLPSFVVAFALGLALARQPRLAGDERPAPAPA
jgi:nucleobase:cation symporter-1, NCS1 family